MNLLDRAIKLAAEQDEPVEMNFVRKHALEQAEDLGVSVRDAATRVFSNASGEGPAPPGAASSCTYHLEAHPPPSSSTAALCPCLPSSPTSLPPLP